MYRSRYALWKNPENLTAHQQQQLEWIAKTDPPVADLPAERRAPGGVRPQGRRRRRRARPLDQLGRRCRIDAFVALQRRIVKHRPAIDAALDSGLSNALIESTYTKIRVDHRVAFGFHSAEAVIALAMLSLGGYPPVLPGRDY